MEDQEKEVEARDYNSGKYIGENIMNDQSVYREEASSELIGPVSLTKPPYDPSDNRAETTYAANQPSRYREESAAEIAAPVSLNRRRSYDDLNGETADGAGTGVGFLALALSIISLFVMPILFGAAGIVLGFIARARGAGGVGAWAIGIGLVSIVIAVFVIPFF